MTERFCFAPLDVIFLNQETFNTMLELKIQLKIGKNVYSISKSGDKVTYWSLATNKKLNRQVASKVEDAATLKKLQSIYAKIEKAAQG